MTASKGSAGILQIGKNFELIGMEDDDVAISKNTYNAAAVIALTLIKDCWYCREWVVKRSHFPALLDGNDWLS